MRLQEEEKYFLDKFSLGLIKRKRTMNYEPLEITFYLSAPISLTAPWMFFDSLVGELLLKEALRDDYYVLPTKYPVSKLVRELEMPPFPIKITNDLYHSSVSLFDVDRKYLENLFKKFEDKWAGGKKKIQKGSGYFRDYLIKHIYIPARYVKFYVCGDAEILEKVCSYIVGLGDNTRIGWGAVREIRILKARDDYSIVKDGVAMRPIPRKFVEDAEEFVLLPWRPPYWDAGNVDVCVPPGARCQMKKEVID